MRVRVAAAAALSALSAYLAAGGSWPAAWPLAAGVFLLASGACALNEWQERRTDGLMLRTRGRPIPSGLVRPRTAALAAGGMLAAGSGLLLAAGGGWALGLAAVAWYNGVYTPLKRRTAFAAVPGALVGTVPPALGWLAAGGSLADGRILVVCFFFYLWQVPHFWLLATGQEKDLAAAGLPGAGAALGRVRLGRLAAVWMCVAAASTCLFPLFGATSSATASAALLAASCALAWRSLRLLGEGTADGDFRRAFAEINAFALAVLVLIAADPVLRA
ncbi:MAG: UbiA family prenyltransferase [Elusimicrobia bacterium]|nr:UbiA family prenyltransferase [Elusimicrobiota bacterium]